MLPDHYSRFACRSNIVFKSSAFFSINRMTMMSKKISRLCSNSDPIGCTEAN